LGRNKEAAEATILMFEVISGSNEGDSRMDAWPLSSSAWQPLGVARKMLSKRAKAMSILEKVACGKPEAFQKNNGRLLASLAFTFTCLGQNKEALKFAQGATAIFQKLSLLRSDDAQFDLAVSLFSWGCRLFESGRRKEAMPHFKEAFSIIKSPAAQGPAIVEKRFWEIQLNWGNQSLVLVELCSLSKWI
jgi:tetratricopeptide (TPR) repeat protein